MIPNAKKNLTANFSKSSVALEHLNSTTSKHHLLQTKNLYLDPQGYLNHRSQNPIFEGLPLSEVAVGQINHLLKIPEKYAKLIDPKLHAHSVNELLNGLEGSVTVVVVSDLSNSEQKHIAAILPGFCLGIDHKVIVERLEFWGINSVHIHLEGGQMKVRFGNPQTVEVLVGDHVNLYGYISNTRWSAKGSKPSLEASLYWERLVCTNGAFVRRVVAGGRVLNLNSRKEAADFIDGQIKRTLNFNKTVLLPAVQTMASTVPNEDEHEKIVRLLNRHLSKDSASNLVEGVTSNWDAFNAVTAAANQVTSVIARQQLQIAGGAMLEQFMKV